MAKPSALTESRIRTELAAADDAAEVRLYDAKVPGLLLWRRPGGSPRWYVFMRAGGRMRRATVGELNVWPKVPVEQARNLARAIVADLAAGRDPSAAKKAKRAEERGGKVPILDALARHLTRLKDKGRSEHHIAELKRVIEAAAARGVRDLADPGVSAKADAWLRGLDVTAVTRSRYTRDLIAVGRTAMRWWPTVLMRDPFFALTGATAPLPAPAYFTPAESVRLVSDDALARPMGKLVAFLLLSGCRMLEATWARWDRIDLDRATFLVIPPNADERAAGARVKRDKSRTVALQPELVALLRQWRAADPDGVFLFDARWRSSSSKYVQVYRDHLAALGIPLAGRKVHSLRHTHAVLATACGEDSLRMRLSMGHAGEVMAAHYGSAAMRWRGLLHDWKGTFRLRDLAEAERLTKAVPVAKAS